MGISKGEKLGVCVQCSKKGVYTKRGCQIGYPPNAKVCRYCGKLQPKKEERGV